jgi:dihydroorotate dehydrogenase
VTHAHEDYLYCFQKAYPHADYVAINISSPNTPGLRNLQLKDHLGPLLGLIQAERDKLVQKHRKYVPVVVKIAPDLSDAEIFPLWKSFKVSTLTVSLPQTPPCPGKVLKIQALPMSREG